jgi:hypothetical protein
MRSVGGTFAACSATIRLIPADSAASVSLTAALLREDCFALRQQAFGPLERARAGGASPLPPLRLCFECRLFRERGIPLGFQRRFLFARALALRRGGQPPAASWSASCTFSSACLAVITDLTGPQPAALAAIADSSCGAGRPARGEPVFCIRCECSFFRERTGLPQTPARFFLRQGTAPSDASAASLHQRAGRIRRERRFSLRQRAGRIRRKRRLPSAARAAFDASAASLSQRAGCISFELGAAR